MRRNNPWGLTPLQMEVMEKLCEIGCRKVIAYKMNISDQAVQQRIHRSIVRMKVRTDLQAAILFDRWNRKGLQSVRAE